MRNCVAQVRLFGATPFLKDAIEVGRETQTNSRAFQSQKRLNFNYKAENISMELLTSQRMWLCLAPASQFVKSSLALTGWIFICLQVQWMKLLTG